MSDGEARVPCTDEMCVGVFGANGQCGVCGRRVSDDDPAEVRAAVEALTSGEAPVAVEAPPADETVVDALADATEALPQTTTDTADEGERVPCDDEMCTGIYGANGVCGTCGRAR